MKLLSPELTARVARINLLVMDIDGVLTDGMIYYTSSGVEMRAFHVADGLGMVLMRHASILVGWISGRESQIVTRRARELNVGYVYQGVSDKGTALRELARQVLVENDEVGYIGDDWNDLTAFQAAGVKFAVKSAVPDVIAEADYVTEREGGQGAVREVIDLILHAKGIHDEVKQRYLESLRESRFSRRIGQ